MGDKGEGQKMASSAKNLDELFHPAKRLRPLSPSEPPDALIPHSPLSPLRKASPARRDPAPESAAAPALTPEQKQRIEINKALARSKRNLRICRERVEKAKAPFGLFHEWWLIVWAMPAEGMDYVKLEELLVEESWLEALPGELQKPYAKNLCRFVEREARGSVPIYPPPYLIFNALHLTPFDRVKVVIIGQELKEDLGHSVPLHGNLERWAVQGVLLLNAVLTGFVGRRIWTGRKLIDGSKHRILRAAHPSGLSANRGFFGCRHFSETNRALEKLGLSPIDWKL
ncbi:hypothetical protein C4D60_Mb03t13750 [Musa balbisiana]|uniref:Uracil-DNA glycosylase-like domain-containing protein n=1 Tax=Musa balbisiana TaxID=52838 RepID=A0A4S8J9T1_MUSBA|nr:hypothetical protein C4D60_Mb03t13750 [Musa balbisiana]